MADAKSKSPAPYRPRPGVSPPEHDLRQAGSGPALVPAGRMLLVVLFIGSGCSALIYEVVWLQLLQLVIGSTAVSLGVLLGTFMGGMCLGSLLAPRLISRERHPLRVYAALELGIAGLALAVLYALPYVERLYAGAAGGGWAASLALRGVVSMACLLPPTMLMGATLPAISRWVRTTPEGVSWLGFFYGGNITGAVVGCILAGFYLLRLYDMATATYVAVAINLTVATIGLLLASAAPYRQAAADRRNIGSRLPAPARARGIYVAIALSGLTALGAEVVWTRLLSLLLGGTVYTFSIILAVFLLGLGIGSTAGAVLARTSRPRFALGVCQLLLCGAIAWTAYALANSLPYWPINPEISTSPWTTFQLDCARCLWAVLPGAILWGASFPLALGAAAGPNQDPGRLVGGVYAANTLGAIAGALAFSLVLVPLVGTQWAERVLLALAAMSAAVVLAPMWLQPHADVPDRSLTRRAAVAASAIVLAAGAGCTVALLAWNIAPMPWAAVGYGRHCATWVPQVYPGILDAADIALLKKAEGWRINLHAEGDVISYEPKAAGEAGQLLAAAVKPQVEPWIAANREQLLAMMRKGLLGGRGELASTARGGGSADRFCTFLGEGMNVSVAVSESPDGLRYFHGAGKVQASSHPQDMRLQRMLGHITMLAHPDPDAVGSVLVVACGAGVTAGSFVPYENVRRIVICDIEPMVPRYVAPMFAKQNYSVVDDPRTQVVVDDGRHFIRTTREKFDVITSDPIDPWVKGCAALNTREYYEMCKAHLNPGGTMALWLPLYESNFESAKSAIATFFEAFPGGVIWSNDSTDGGYDIVMFGQVEPASRINLDRVQEWLDAHPDVLKSLKDVGFGTWGSPATAQGQASEVAIDLAARYAGQARDMADWTRGAQINTDRNLRLQYLAGIALNSNLSSQIFKDMLLYYKFPDDLFEGSEDRMEALRAAIAAAGRHPPLRLAAPAQDPQPASSVGPQSAP